MMSQSTVSIQTSNNLTLTSNSPMMVVSPNYSTSGWNLDIVMEFYTMLMWVSVRDEFSTIPEDEKKRVEDFINAVDPEMKQLGYSIMEKYVSPGAMRIVREIQTGNSKYHLLEFMEKNCSEKHLSLGKIHY